MTIVSFRRLDVQNPGVFSQYLLPGALKGAGTAAGEFALFGAVWDQSACGAAAARFQNGRGEILSLFVDPLARRQGVGTKLAELLLQESAERGAAELSGSYVLTGEALEGMDAFFASLGAEPEFWAPAFGMDSSLFRESRFFAKIFRPTFRPNAHIQPFSALSAGQLTALATRGDIPSYLLPSACANRLDPALSLAWVEDGRVTAYVLGGETGQNSYTLLAAWREAAAPSTCFFHLLYAQLNRCFYRCGGDFFYYLSAVTPETAALADRLTEGCYTLFEEHIVRLPLPGGSEEGTNA